MQFVDESVQVSTLRGIVGEVSVQVQVVDVNSLDSLERGYTEAMLKDTCHGQNWFFYVLVP